MSAPAAISLRGVTVERAGHTLLDNVSVEVAAGSLVGLIGPNGGGKTTLVKVALGLLRPDRGEVRWFGETPSAARSSGVRVGYVPQRGSWDPRFPLSVEEAVLLGRTGLRGAGSGWNAGDRRAAREAMEFMEIADLARQRLASCSGGEVQRALVARALCIEPRVLILDEPTSAADVAAQDRFHRRLKELKERGMTVLMVSHDVGVIASIADEVACLNQRLHFHGAPRAVLDQENLAAAYGCEIELLSHGHVPHRVLRHHHEDPPQ